MKVYPPSIVGFDALLIDWVDGEGRICAVNAMEGRELAITLEQGESVPLERIYSSTSAQMLRGIARDGQPLVSGLAVWVNSPQYSEIPMIATVVPDPGRGLAVIKQPLPESVLGIGPELAERVEILSQMIGAATEACWCIEFLEPVDTSLAEDEIVARIFSNQSRWRACNEAMARLYRVPEGLDFNIQPVSRYFPATEINRRMVRDLVRSGYRLDRAAAVDRRHDDSEMLVENDFRAAIKDGFLVRLWGTTRDIGAHRQREQQLADRADTMQDILSAVPDPILVISEDGLLLATNPAAESVWGRTAEQVLGRPLQQFIETRNALEKLRQAAFAGEDSDGECDLAVIAADASRDVWRFRAARIEGEMRRYVLTARRKSRRKTRGLLQEAAS